MVIGGKGRRRTPELAVPYASDFTLPFVFIRERRGCSRTSVCWRVRPRDLSTLTFSNALAVCAGRDETEARRRADAIGRDLDELRHDGLAGSPDAIVDKIGRTQLWVPAGSVSRCSPCMTSTMSSSSRAVMSQLS